MTQRPVRTVFVRGGTSKALVFRREDLPAGEPPANTAAWDRIFLSAMGSPDPSGRQLDGMGGGISSLSKVAVVGLSSRDDADVDYTFGQVLIDKAVVGYGGNCGNISSAIGPFAIDEGLVSPRGETAEIRIYNTNTKKIIVSRFAVAGGKAVTEGDLAIDGVSGTGAPVRLSFLEPGGAATGKLLPTGKTSEMLTLDSGRTVEASLVDVANPVVFVRGADLGFGAFAPADKAIHAPQSLALYEEIRVAAAEAMGLVPNREVARTAMLNLPLVAIVFASADFTAISGRRIGAGEIDACVQFVSSGQPHKATPMTGAMCMAVAARIPGSVVAAGALGDGDFRIGHPSGILTVSATVAEKDGEVFAVEATVLRTQRRLMSGEVYVAG
ncbi:MAG: 2-methylaconitate cis-trans isomerase PrpF family protein [Flavobacteriaceae bacterium]